MLQSERKTVSLNNPCDYKRIKCELDDNLKLRLDDRSCSILFTSLKLASKYWPNSGRSFVFRLTSSYPTIYRQRAKIIYYATSVFALLIALPILLTVKCAHLKHFCRFVCTHMCVFAEFVLVNIQTALFG